MELRSLAKSFNNSKESEMSSSASQRIMTIQTVMEISIYMMVKWTQEMTTKKIIKIVGNEYTETISTYKRNRKSLMKMMKTVQGRKNHKSSLIERLNVTLSTPKLWL